MVFDPNVIIVINSVLTIFALSTCLAGWADQRVPVGGLLVLAAELGVFAYVHLFLLVDGLTIWSIPEAFVHVAAKLF
jgi:hypothetical protein